MGVSTEDIAPLNYIGCLQQQCNRWVKLLSLCTPRKVILLGAYVIITYKVHEYVIVQSFYKDGTDNQHSSKNTRLFLT